MQLDEFKGDTTDHRLLLALQLLVQMLPILSQLHQKQLVHCDIKPENLMISGKDVFLLDQGLVSPSHESGLEPNLFGGTFEYLPPNLLLDTEAKVAPSRDW